MAKAKSTYFCQNSGAQSTKWFVIFIVLLSISCKEEGTKTKDKTIEDSLKNNTSMQKEAADTTSATDTIESNTSDESQNLSAEKDVSLLIGSWDDVDPNDPGPGSQSIYITADGKCSISEQEGGYEGNWSYNPTMGILNLRLSHTNGSGVIDKEIDKDYKIEELTEYKIEISDIQDGYPSLSGSFWKSQN